ncbi:MAG: M28 family peptidase [Planctomycetota bacterium]
MFAAFLAACSSGPVPEGGGGGSNGPAAGSGGGVAAGPAGVDPALAGRAKTLCERALADNEAIEILKSLVAAAPKRLSGSKGAADAVQWGLRTMRDLGLSNVRAEPCTVNHWERGEETASVVSPEPMPLAVTALGGSVPTPQGGITAELVEVRSFEQLRALGDAARGKIVLFNRPMPRILARTGMAYGAAVPQRTNGAVEAAKAGAVAALVRSMTTTIDEHPHTGMMSYDASVPKVPAAAVSTRDAEALSSMLERGPVRVNLRLGCRTLEPVESANVIGEIEGTEHPEKIVVIGGHLDAWDLGEGAHDDGAGIAHVLEAARLLLACGVRPKATIRVVLFMNEENGLSGGKAYEAAHGGEPHIAAIETDSGGFAPRGFSCSLPAERANDWKARFAPLDAYDIGAFLTGGGGGADISPLARRGVPLLGLVVVGHRYFDYHHSALDVIANVNERELALGAAAVAYAASVLAE